jgi:hypothetical protein
MTRSRTKALSDRRGAPRQLDLFGGNRPRSIGDALTCSALPVEASEVIDPMRLMIVDHVDREQRNAAAGAGQLGCYGSPIRTSNIDRLAANGLLYTNMHTTALCSPIPVVDVMPPRKRRCGDNRGCG